MPFGVDSRPSRPPSDSSPGARALGLRATGEVFLEPRSGGARCGFALCQSIAGLLIAGSLLAHDFWVEPETFEPLPSSAVSIQVQTGEHLRGNPLPRDPTHIRRFILSGPAGEIPVGGVDGALPAGVARVGTAGIYWIGYASHHRSVRLQAAKFEAYLKEEGLTDVLDERQRRGETQSWGREIFSRSAKALLRVGGIAGEGHDRRLDLALELVPEQDPGTLEAEEELPVRLLFRAQPLAGTRVVAIPRVSGEEISRRTDEDGRVRFPLPAPGTWLIKAVHMTRLPPGGKADWESFWASLTFRRGDRRDLPDAVGPQNP